MMRTVLLAVAGLAVGGSALALDFPVASCKSWNGTVLELGGVNTGRATMKGTVTKPDIQEYCQRDPGGETRESGGKLTKVQCVDNYVREAGTTELFSEASCAAGTVLFRYGSRAPSRAKFPLRSDADTSCASGMPPLVAQF